MKFITVALLFLLTIPGLSAPKPSFELIEIEGASNTSPHGINDNGDVSGYLFNHDGQFGFIKKGSQVTLLSVPGGTGTRAFGIDNEGRVVGHFWEEPIEIGANVKGFIYENGQYTVVSHPNADPYPGTQLVAIAAGRAVGTFQSAFSTHGFLVENGQFTLIDVPGASHTFPLGINAAGKVVGWYQDSLNTQHGFIWQNGQFQSIDFPQPGAITILYALNSDTIVGTEVVGGSCDAGLFLLRHGKFLSLDLPGVNVYGINEAGTIVGEYGRSRGFIAQASKFILRGN